MTDERLTLTVDETAELLGIGRASAYAACAAGELPTVKLGRRILVPRARLLALLGELPADNTKGGNNSEEANGPGASLSASDRDDTRTALEP